ncbi:MAG: rhodanese-like domain-containing protein [Microbacterium sp.]
MTAPEPAPIVPGPLVDADWLDAHHDDPRLRILDATVGVAVENGVRRWVDGREAFEKDGHIPGAQHADLIRRFSAESDQDFALPAADRFATAAASLGITEHSTVVVYDTTSTTWATRLRWLFRYFGHRDVAVLDGGLHAWTSSGRAPEYGPAAPVTVDSKDGPLRAVPRTAETITTDGLRGALEDGELLVVSALPAADFTGERSPRPRAGRIPGSINIPAGVLADPDTHRIRPLTELRQLLAPVLDHDGPVVVHCGAGVSATYPLLALELLGRDDVLLYEESLNVWAADPANPLETGPASD